MGESNLTLQPRVLPLLPGGLPGTGGVGSSAAVVGATPSASSFQMGGAAGVAPGQPVVMSPGHRLLLGGNPDVDRQLEIIGFFPGMRSQSAYQDLGSAVYDTGVKEVRAIYHRAAVALGLTSDGRADPTPLFRFPENRAGDAVALDAVAVRMLVHNLALFELFKKRTRVGRLAIPASFKAFTGEGYGLLATLSAAGSLSLEDGIRLVQALNATILKNAEVQEYPPHRVVLLKGVHIHRVIARLLLRYGQALSPHQYDSELFQGQVGLYVHPSVYEDFQKTIRDQFPDVKVTASSEPTTFMPHSILSAGARQELEAFIDRTGIVFEAPKKMVMANNGTGLIENASQVRQAILDLVDRPLFSGQNTVIADLMEPDLIVSFGSGGETRELMDANQVETPLYEFTGNEQRDQEMYKVMLVIKAVRGELDRLRNAKLGTELTNVHYELLRNLFALTAGNEFAQECVYDFIQKIVKEELMRPDRRQSSTAFHEYISILQNTYLVHHVLKNEALSPKALILSVVFKKRLVCSSRKDTCKIDCELMLLNPSGETMRMSIMDYKYPETVTLGFQRLPQSFETLAQETERILSAQPRIREIYEEIGTALGVGGLDYFTDTEAPVDDRRRDICMMAYQFAMSKLLAMYRPSLLGQNNKHLVGADSLGAFTAIAVSGSISIADAIRLYLASQNQDAGYEALLGSIDLKDPGISVVDPSGVIDFRGKDQLRYYLRNLGTTQGRERAPGIKLNYSSWFLSFSDDQRASPVESIFTIQPVAIPSLDQIWRTSDNTPLETLHKLSILRFTDERGIVYQFAEGRGITTETVYAYVESGERIVGFGNGGSGSLTIFLRRPGVPGIVVRKILSENLVTALWDREGTGAMLPPFQKLLQQAHFLEALPQETADLFPSVLSVDQRQLVIPPDMDAPASLNGVWNETIYDMKYVEGTQVSELIKEFQPGPRIVARLYREIFRVLRERVHSQRRQASETPTLEESYFTKIEKRLALSQGTAPNTFSDQLLASANIYIDGEKYLNIGPILGILRAHPEFQEILEPHHLSLVMGDTNTENIMVRNIEPILRAIAQGTADFTAEEIGITFLDPRAIGFRSEGSTTVDDSMYDAKPWHNSLAGYDMMHGEHFDLTVATAPDGSPSLSVHPHPDHPFSAPYAGIEEFFEPTMTEAWGLNDPDSEYLREDPYWLVRFVFMMGTHFAAMPPFHFKTDIDGNFVDSAEVQKRPLAIYAEGIKWLNLALRMLQGETTEYLGFSVAVPSST